jgi:hypothetical protein
VDALKKGLKALRDEYLGNLKERAKDVTPLNRASERFETVYAAGALAIRLGVLDWKRSALGEAVMSCQLDGLKELRGTKEGTTVSAMNKKLAYYLRRNEANSMEFLLKRCEV